MRCFTIGHSNHNESEFLKLLRMNQINCLVDVRTNPHSQYVTQFNKERLEVSLKLEKIVYLHFGKEFGARREEAELYTDGIVDFKKTIQSEIFQKGVARIQDGIQKGFRIALMCSEEDPIRCHRFGMVSYGLYQLGIETEHIRGDGSIQTREECEDRIAEEYKIKNFRKLGNQSIMIGMIYQVLNQKIGYHFGSEQENSEDEKQILLFEGI